MLFPSWFEIGLDIAQLSLPVVVLVGFIIYLRRRSMRADRSDARSTVLSSHFRPEAQ